MDDQRPYVLSIAGFDPSGGAGILADIKTFEMNKTVGFGVCTAITFQNDREFFGVNWLEQDEIIMQIESLFRRFSIEWVKIGLVQDLAVLKEIIERLNDLNSKVKIIWDPILKASAGFPFHNEINQELLKQILNKLFLITPNLEEIVKLSLQAESDKGAKKLSKYCKVLLKGGHSTNGKALDVLYEMNEKSLFESDMIEGTKHGTGCVLSAAILSNLSKGKSIKEACIEGKNYINEFILSQKGLLGYHYHNG